MIADTKCCTEHTTLEPIKRKKNYTSPCVDYRQGPTITTYYTLTDENDCKGVPALRHQLNSMNGFPRFNLQ